MEPSQLGTIEAVFFDDAYCEYGFFNGSAKEFINYAMAALQDHQSNHHMVGNILIDIEGDEAFGEVCFNAHHKLTTSNGLEDMIIAGRYLDQYEKRQGVWKIAYRSEVVDWSHSRPNNDPYFEAVPNTLVGQRSNDAVYDRKARYAPNIEVP